MGFIIFIQGRTPVTTLGLWVSIALETALNDGLTNLDIALAGINVLHYCLYEDSKKDLGQY